MFHLLSFVSTINKYISLLHFNYFSSFECLYTSSVHAWISDYFNKMVDVSGIISGYVNEIHGGIHIERPSDSGETTSTDSPMYLPPREVWC